MAPVLSATTTWAFVVMVLGFITYAGGRPITINNSLLSVVLHD